MYFVWLNLVEVLVELLVTIVEKQPKVCRASHITTLLSAYLATMATTGNCVHGVFSTFVSVTLYHSIQTVVFFTYCTSTRSMECLLLHTGMIILML